MRKSALGLLRDRHAALEETVHIGVMLPWANTVVEAELPRLSLDKVVWHYGRLMPANAATRLDDTFLKGLIRAVPEALEQMSRLPLAVSCVACTSADFSYPGERWGGPPGGIVTAFEALGRSLLDLGIRRVALLTPYPLELTVREVAAFSARDFEVVAHACLGLDDDLALVPAEQIHGLLLALESARLARAEALVLSCTGWPTLSLLPDLEERLGIPVLSSNLALALATLGVATAMDRA